jgi:UDP-GlcNAc:undecaprenyl-phosphate GlcNAc-1-phosphate transferase
MLTQQTTTAMSQAVPLLILGIPMLDTILVTIQRLREGRSPFRADKNHIHHKFLVLGFDHYEAVFLIYLLHSLLVVFAYLLRFESDFLIVLVSGVFSLGVISSFKLASATGWRAHRHGSSFYVESTWARAFSSGQWLLKIAYYFTLGAIPVYLISGAALPSKVPTDIGFLSLLLLAVMLAIQFRGPDRPLNIVERAGTYAAGIFVTYLNQVYPGLWSDWSLYRNLLLIALTGCVVIGFRFSAQRFRATPLDYLVIFIALLVPHLPDFRTAHFGSGVAMAIVYCYASELVLNNTARRWNSIRLINYAALVVLAVRGLTQ